MESFFPAIWNVLHDGPIDRIEGNVPGDIQVFVGIEYLRKRFPDAGEEIVVHLFTCKTFSHRLYDAEDAETELASIAERSVSILNAEMKGKICQVFTDVGILEIECERGSLSLDSGREIALDELLSVAEAYWDEWKSNSTPEPNAEPENGDL